MLAQTADNFIAASQLRDAGPRPEVCEIVTDPTRTVP